MTTTSTRQYTTSNISMFMKNLGYKWSNEAQIYYNDIDYVDNISRKLAEKLYIKLILNK